MIAWLRRLIRIRLRPHRDVWLANVWCWADETFVDVAWSLRCRENEKRNVSREREWFMLRHLNAIERAAMFGSSVA